ncbi:MAG TPA: hypothetical protein VKE70_16240 [Candidatus Solibacter sp.]|nr:hypothetical protein [Candidatus Solibacter sp.]
MRTRTLSRALAAALFAVPLAAQDNTDLLNRLKAMEDRIKALEAEVQSLKGPPATPAAPAQQPPAVAPAPEPPQPVTLGGAGPAASKALNPDISVIGDFLGAAGNPANRPTPSLEMHETEVAFQEIIDPYARADVFLSFGEHGVDLEEGYLTFTSLPAGLQVKAGKMRAAFGKVNTLHNHVLPWTDRPLVTQDLVGGEDGISDAGVSLSRLLPAPKGIFLEATAQVYRGDSETVFHAFQRSDLSTVEHLRAYADISESTNIDIGGSFARGKSPFAPEKWNQLYGFDATLRWKPLRRAIYHSFVARTEFIWARTQLTNPLLQGPSQQQRPQRDPFFPLFAQITPFGYYASGDYQFARRWFLGGRFDRSQRGACQPTNPMTVNSCNQPFYSLVQDTGGSLIVTYWPSEFSQIRGQFRRTKYGDSFTTNELLFQLQFSMGAHGAHPF